MLKRTQIALGEANYVPYVLIVSTGMAIIGKRSLVSCPSIRRHRSC
jgi:hypothetical protein